MAGLALAAAALLVAGCVSMGGGRDGRGWVERGEASWYGPGFQGRRTASGERYDMHRLTAAHPTLPFGSIVEVTNLDNGQRVRVRINDRGPFARGRVIDLSYLAAKRIDMVRAGTATVELRLVHRAGGEPVVARYAVQVGAFREKRRAREVLRRLTDTWPDARIEGDGTWNRVLVGDFPERDGAERLLQEILQAGFAAVVTPVS